MKVSIFTPTHNSSFLRQVYASIRNQAFSEWIILHNGGSQPIEFGDPRVKQYIAEGDKPWVGALKAEASSHCSGDILLELDHDDLLAHDAITEVVKAFEDDPEVGFVYSNTIHMYVDPDTGAEGKVQRFSEHYGWRYREVFCGGLELDEHISFPPTPDSISRIWYAPNHLRAFRRDVYESIGGYDREMRILDDFDLMSRLYVVTKFKHIDQGLYVYRVHGQNTWLDPAINQEIQVNTYRLYNERIEPLAERWADINGLRKVELGGRMAAKAGFETVDLRDADVNCDLNHPWPFADSSVGVIRAFDVFEHLRDPLFTMKELSRVLAPGGWAFIQVPSTDGRGAFQDRSHVSFWNENSFGYYTRSDLAKYIDTPVRFQAPLLCTTPKDADRVCWVVAHLINLKADYRPAGEILI